MWCPGSQSLLGDVYFSILKCPEPRSPPAHRRSMAAIPSSGSLVATHDYYRRRLGSASSNSSCGSAEYPGEAIPHHPGLPKADPGHWWASFFFGKSTLPFMATVVESPEHSESTQASTSMVTSGLAPETTKQQPVNQPGQASTGSQS
ncbi:pancreatic progenitor cell differentiation and proliferation factor isoform X2 [Urocitellus parryii]